MKDITICLISKHILTVKAATPSVKMATAGLKYLLSASLVQHEEVLIFGKII